MLFTDASLSRHIPFPEVGNIWKKEREPTSPRPTPVHLLAPRALIHEDGDGTWQFDLLFGRNDLITSVGHGPTGIDTAHLL